MIRRDILFFRRKKSQDLKIQDKTMRRIDEHYRQGEAHRYQGL